MNHAERANKRADALTNRARLLEAAQAVFAQSGLDLEVTDIAARAQVGIGTLYRHFGNREDLLRAIITAIVDDVLNQIHLAVQPYADDPRAALFALVSAGLRVQHQYQSVFSVVRDSRLAKLFDRAYGETRRTQFLDQARGIIERGIQTGIFRADLDPDVVAATIFGSFTGVFENLGERYPLAELEQRLSQLLWTMVAKEGGHPASLELEKRIEGKS
jgi:AcrR family transcriptional regulator